MPIKPNIVGATLLLAMSMGGAPAQAAPPTVTVTYPSSAAASERLSDLPNAPWAQSPQHLTVMPSPKALPPRGAGPGAGEGEQHGQGPDIGIQSKTSFAGIGANGFIPSDANIAVGKTNSAGAGYIVQVVNTEISVYNKTGTLLTGPVQLDSLWTPLGGVCAGSKAGDPIIQYDSVADRWLVAQLGSQSSPYYECIAVSQTGDPRGTYNLYSYPFNNNLNDYPKFGVWPTASNPAYLATYNLFSNGQTFVGSELCAYDRNAMTSGAANPAQLCFTIANDGNFLPSDLDGRSPPADGTPGYFLNFETLSSLRLYELSPDFSATPPSATLTHVTPDMTVASFAEACNGGVCIPQPNSERLDSLGDRLMYRLAYRVFSDHVAMVVNHSVMAGSSVGVRWYELRQSALSSTQCSSFTAGVFYLCQYGTFAPDSTYRWMGSAAMDGAGDIALGYSASSSNLYPSISFTGRTPTMAIGVMGPETILQAGKGAQTTYNRWGDYSSLRIDPDDDTTFWYTNEYYTSNNRFFNYLWSTVIGSFTIGGSSTAADFTLSAPPTPLTVTRGSSNSTTVTVTAVNGSSSVNLSLSGLRKGASDSFATNPVTATTGGASSILTISASRNAATGTFIITISGSNGSATHGIPLSVTIQ